MNVFGETRQARRGGREGRKAGGRGPHLHEELDGALGHVQVAGAQIRPLVHGGGRVYEEKEDRHGPGEPRGDGRGPRRRRGSRLASSAIPHRLRRARSRSGRPPLPACLPARPAAAAPPGRPSAPAAGSI